MAKNKDGFTAHRLTYQVMGNITYVYAADLNPESNKGKVKRTKELKNGLLVDLNSEGEVLGVEIMNPSKITLAEIIDALGLIQQWKKEN